MKIYILIFVSVILYSFIDLKNLLASFIFLNNKSNIGKDRTDCAKKGNKIIILIPVLREQEIIIKNLNLFTRLKGNYELVYITTQREGYEKVTKLKDLNALKHKINTTANLDNFVEHFVGFFPHSLAIKLYKEKNRFDNYNDYWDHILNTYKNLKNTAELIDDYIKNEKVRCKHVRRIHYPYVDGLMSHQLNYASKELLKTHNTESTYVLIYNADSVVENRVLDKFFEKISSGETVLMQSSLFLENYFSFSSNLRGSILKCIALAQSRWTLIHEMSRINRQYKGGIRSIYESAHVVGHGTCIRLDVLFDVGGFPEIFTNEDLPLGYFLSLAGKKICLIPILENSESPTTIKSVITQYTTWFYGAMDYFSYYNHAVQNYNTSKTKALLWAIVNSIRAMLWFLSPWIWVFLIFTPLFWRHYLLSFFAAGIFLFHTIFIYWITIEFISNNPQTIGKTIFPIKFEKGLLIAIPLSYIIWGIGPVRSVFFRIKANLAGTKVDKNKTER